MMSKRTNIFSLLPITLFLFHLKSYSLPTINDVESAEIRSISSKLLAVIFLILTIFLVSFVLCFYNKISNNLKSKHSYNVCERGKGIIWWGLTSETFTFFPFHRIGLQLCVLLWLRGTRECWTCRALFIIILRLFVKENGEAMCKCR